jgi:hypothetical protein
MAKDAAPMRTPNETRLAFESPIYEMEARLGEMEVQYAKNRAGGDTSSARFIPTSTRGKSSRFPGISKDPRRATISTSSSSSFSNSTATEPSAMTRPS